MLSNPTARPFFENSVHAVSQVSTDIASRQVLSIMLFWQEETIYFGSRQLANL